MNNLLSLYIFRRIRKLQDWQDYAKGMAMPQDYAKGMAMPQDYNPAKRKPDRN